MKEVQVKLERKYANGFGTCFCGEVLGADPAHEMTYVNFMYQQNQDKAKWIADILAEVKVAFPDATVVLHPDSLSP